MERLLTGKSPDGAQVQRSTPRMVILVDLPTSGINQSNLASSG